MIYQFLKRINIDRPYVFYTLVFVIFVLPLTYVNNFYYYKSIAKVEKTAMLNMANTLNKFSEMCVKLPNNNTTQCIDKLKRFLSSNKDSYGSLVIITAKNKLLLKHDNRWYVHSRLPINLKDVEGAVTTIRSLDANIAITKNSIPNIWYSVYKSVTFSIADIIQKDGIRKKWSYIKRVAIPRSTPFFSFLLIALLIMYFVKKSIIAQIEFINEFEDLEDPKGVGSIF
ncbi:hypothetical protein [Bathymodiolus thermophilus thioautotrophic gill symbiont]|nr:hypothetical protein [Bathymodiolus thermophilus thioautotrophic gill symbiont]AYQ56242.1 hypothetical protein MS2017_0501 [Bathymodiolus thermophilus thioautotrophic gill symbiont]OIR25269.1 hypothetical protein BGC33_13015 [Bathymodiolus thermophilus thioautotrophic gill symbiont]